MSSTYNTEYYVQTRDKQLLVQTYENLDSLNNIYLSSIGVTRGNLVCR